LFSWLLFDGIVENLTGLHCSIQRATTITISSSSSCGGALNSCTYCVVGTVEFHNMIKVVGKNLLRDVSERLDSSGVVGTVAEVGEVWRS